MEKTTGPVSVVVKLAGGSLHRCHQDQIRKHTVEHVPDELTAGLPLPLLEDATPIPDDPETPSPDSESTESPTDVLRLLVLVEILYCDYTPHG